MKNIEILIDIEKLKAQSSMIYQTLGKFGDQISKSVQDELRRDALRISQDITKKEKRINI